jgi:hypothetical protein
MGLIKSLSKQVNKFTKNALSICLLVFLANSIELAAEKNDSQIWTLLTTNISLDQNKKFFVYAEAQPRIADNVSDIERLLLRTALGYNHNSTTSLFLGYAWTPTFLDSKYQDDFRDESRIWQQILKKHKLFGLDWQHRLRQEQRIIQNTGGTAHRNRYLIRASYLIDQKNNYGLTGYNELFTNLNSVSNGPKAGFDRNRFFFGPFWQTQNTRYEFGYLGEYGKRFGGEDRMINALMLSANFNF